MALGFWAYDWEYWNLYHKVTFDGPNKLILVNEGVLSLDWKEDVYSAWKEWVRINNHIENPGFLEAMRVIGGDNITADGSRKVGATFFLSNGWRLKPWGGDYRLSIVGNVYTEEGDAIYVPVDGDYKIVIEQTLSSLVELVTLEGTSGGGGNAPSAIDVADAVWNRMANVSSWPGTFGEYIASIKNTGESSAAELAVANAKLDQVSSELDDVSVELQEVSVELDAVNTKLDTATTLIQTLIKYEGNRTKIDQTAKTLTVFDDDGVTPFKVFDLRNFAGSASITEVAERAPQ